MDIGHILSKFHPGKEWAVVGNQSEYSSIQWSDESPKPSEKEMLDLSKQMEQEKAIQSIKLEARKRILEMTGSGEFWQEKQMNMIARGVELYNMNSRTLEEQNELDKLNKFWFDVKAIRARSNELERNVLKGEQVDIAEW